MRTWKPGDVALVDGYDDGPVIGIVRVRRETGTLRLLEFVYEHGFDLISSIEEDPDYNARPLVVIDPEDREQVERLCDLIENCGDENHCSQNPCGSMSCWADRVQKALREFAQPTPPKPDEPMGLGAVVEDADDVRWVRIEPEYDHDPRWYGVESVNATTVSHYHDINVVKVLSEGVTP